MILCIPTNDDNGLNSQVCGHFGSAPNFLIVDTEQNKTKLVVNHNTHDQHGMCNPLKNLAGINIDAIVVGGIGMGAYSKLRAANINVYVSHKATVSEIVAEANANQLVELAPEQACAHHGQHHG